MVLTGERSWQPRHVGSRKPLVWLTFDMPDYGQRRQLLIHFLQQAYRSATVATADTLELNALANQFVLTTGQLRDVVQTAVDQAAQAQRPLQSADLFAAARAHSNPNLDLLAHKLTARYDWVDIVLPADQRANLDELIKKVEKRRLVLDEWGVGKRLAPSTGISALFAGDPGTGKTMAAEVVARPTGDGYLQNRPLWHGQQIYWRNRKESGAGLSRG